MYVGFVRVRRPASQDLDKAVRNSSVRGRGGSANTKGVTGEEVRADIRSEQGETEKRQEPVSRSNLT